VIGPLPPPYHGVTVSTSLVLANRRLQASFDLRHLDTSDERSGQNIGKWDARNVLLALSAVTRLWRTLRHSGGVVYLPLSQSLAGFVRDSLFIHLAAVRGWKVAVHLRGSEFRTFYEASSPLVRRWIRLTLNHVTSVAVMGESLRWVFEGLVPARRIVVVPNGTPDPKAEGTARDDTTVLYLSNLRRRKGVGEAIDAAIAVTRKHRGARFLFVGEWEDDELAAESIGRASEADGRIEFRGPVTGAEKDSLLAKASVVLFPPTEPEGHPRVVIEALAAGVPVVSTDRGAIAETIIDGETGFVLPDPEPNALAERILLLLSDHGLREQMSGSARKRYLARFTQEHADRALAEWLSSLAGV
jgi:glycosyltransferase involved in cell wall biosynthesis